MKMVTRLAQIATVFYLIKSLIPFLRAPSSLYTTFLLHVHHTCASQIRRCKFLSHQPPLKALR